MFDALMDPKRQDAYQMPGYGGYPETTDGKEPLCGELIAWRHPTFGNYTDAELAASFVSAHDCYYTRKLFSGFECLTWLMSNDANWMPQHLRETLLEGMRKKTFWWSHDIMYLEKNAFAEALLRRPHSKFKFTREVRSALVQLFGAALNSIRVDERPEIILERFIARELVDGYYDEQDTIRRARQNSR